MPSFADNGDAFLDALLNSPLIDLYTTDKNGNRISVLSWVWQRSDRLVTLVKKILERTPSFGLEDPVVTDAVLSDASDEVIRTLIAKGANVNLAVTKAQSNEIDGSGAKTRRYTRYTKTALYAAVENKRPNLVRMLLAHGADAEWRAPGGKSIRELDTTPRIKALLK